MGAGLGDEMIAAAILDRLLHYSHTMVIQGDSYRLKQLGTVPLVTNGDTPGTPKPYKKVVG